MTALWWTLVGIWFAFVLAAGFLIGYLVLGPRIFGDRDD